MAPKTVVLDTAPLLTGVNLASLGVGRFVTVPEVLAEVRDSWARRSLQFASPFDIELRAPSEEAIKTGGWLPDVCGGSWTPSNPFTQSWHLRARPATLPRSRLPISKCSR